MNFLKEDGIQTLDRLWFGRTLLCMLIAMAAGLAFGQTAPSSLQAGSPWPKFHANNQNLGQGVGSGCSGIVNWSANVGIDIEATPTIDANGTVYVGSNDEYMYALDGATGAVNWSFKAGNTIYSSVAIGANDTIYFGSNDDNVYALDGASGTMLWSFPTGNAVRSSPAIGADGTVYIGSWDGNVYALDGATGTKEWSFTTGNAVVSSPAIGADGTVYIGSLDHSVYALDGATGAKQWSFQTGYTVTSSPAIGANGIVYIGSVDNNLYALDESNGSLVWIFGAGGEVASSPAIGPDGSVYVGSGSWAWKFYSLNGQTGAENWAFQADQGIVGAPAIGADGTIYFSGGFQYFFAVDSSTGQEKWSFTTGTPSADPSIGADGTVYLGITQGGNSANKLYAFGTAPNLVGVSTSSATVEGGSASSGTASITLSYPTNVNVQLSSSSPDLNVPSSVTIPSGSTSESFTFRSSVVSSPVSATVTASIGTSSQQTTVTIEPAPITSLSIPAPSSILRAVSPSLAGGITAAGTISLGGPAGSSGDAVSLSSNNSALTVPAAVNVARGEYGAFFQVSTSSVTSVQQATVTATLGSSSVQTTVSVYPYAPISSFWVAPAEVVGGSGTRGYIDLSGKATTAGSLISISSSSSDITVPAKILISSGNWSGSFSIETASVSSAEQITVTASLQASSMQTTVTLTPSLPIGDFYASPSVVTAGGGTDGVVQLGGEADSTGAVVSLASNNSAAPVPASVTVPSGSTGISFPIATSQVSTVTTVQFTATLGSSTVSTTITLVPNAILNFYLAATSSTNRFDGVVQLVGVAPPGGAMVSLSCSNSAVSVPASVVVPAGKTGVSFYVNASKVPSGTVIVISGAYGESSAQASFTTQ